MRSLGEGNTGGEGFPHSDPVRHRRLEEPFPPLGPEGGEVPAGLDGVVVHRDDDPGHQTAGLVVAADHGDECHPTHRMETLATLKTVTICPSYLTKLSPAWELFKVERPLGMAGPNRPRVMTSAGATSPRSVRGSVGSLTSRSRIWAAGPGRPFERTGE